MKKFLALVLALVLALSLAACSGGAGYQIGIPADATNGGRALLLLQDLGILTLKEGVGLEATEQDIVENPHNVTIKAMEAANLPASLPDLDFAVINGNYASGAGIGGLPVLPPAEQADRQIASSRAPVSRILFRFISSAPPILVPVPLDVHGGHLFPTGARLSTRPPGA